MSGAEKVKALIKKGLTGEETAKIIINFRLNEKLREKNEFKKKDIEALAGALIVHKENVIFFEYMRIYNEALSFATNINAYLAEIEAELFYIQQGLKELWIYYEIHKKLKTYLKTDKTLNEIFSLLNNNLNIRGDTLSILETKHRYEIIIFNLNYCLGINCAYIFLSKKLGAPFSALLKNNVEDVLCSIETFNKSMEITNSLKNKKTKDYPYIKSFKNIKPLKIETFTKNKKVQKVRGQIKRKELYKIKVYDFGDPFLEEQTTKKVLK